MKTQKLFITLFIAAMLFANRSFAQLPVLEKSYDISRKAKNGYLGGIYIDTAKSTFDMVYVLRSSARKVKREIYTFDKELNLVNTVKDEEDVERMRHKYKWFNFKGDSYVSHSLSASANLTGKLVFRKKEITWKYLWLTGSYNKSVKQLEKVKPITDDGDKYFFRGGSYEVKADSTVLVIAGKQEKSNDLVGSMMHYRVLSCDNNVNIKVAANIDFQYPNAPIFSSPLDDDDSELDNDDDPRDWVAVFAPQGNANGIGKSADPQPTDYTYVRMDTKGNVLERFNFQSPSNGWRVLGAYEHEGAVFLYGSSNTKDPDSKYINQMYKTGMVPTTSASESEQEESGSGSSISKGFSMLAGTADLGTTQTQIDLILDDVKYGNFQIGKIQHGKFDFIANPAVDEFEQKKEKPIGQKKYVDFDGKSFVINGISFSSAGDIFVSGQDFKKKKQTRIYRGVYMFQFSPKGDLKKNYGVFLDQSKTAGFFNNSPLTSDMIPSRSYIQESGDGKSLYWMMRMAKSTHKESHTTYGIGSSTTTTTWTPLYSMEYGSINIQDNSLSDFKTLGESEKKQFYLFPNVNSTMIGNYSLFFSETERGDKVLLSRVDLSK